MQCRIDLSFQTKEIDPLEEVKSHFRRGKQRLVKEVEFTRSGLFLQRLLFAKKRKTVAICQIRYLVRIVEHRIKNFLTFT